MTNQISVTEHYVSSEAGGVPRFMQEVWPLLTESLGPNNPIYLVNNSYLEKRVPWAGRSGFERLTEEFKSTGYDEVHDGVLRIPSLMACDERQRKILPTVLSYNGHLNALIGINGEKEKCERVGRLWPMARRFMYGEAEPCGVKDWREFGMRVLACLSDAPLLGFEHDARRLYVFRRASSLDDDLREEGQISRSDGMTGPVGSTPSGAVTSHWLGPL